MASLAASGLTALCVLGLTSGTAGAEAPDVQGWWTVSNPGSPVPAPPAPPDVPANGLLIEGGPSTSSPTSYAGLLYELSSGAVPGVLTLDVAPKSGTTPDTTLELCPLKSPSLQAEQGGPMSDAPAYDCSTHVTAKAASSGDKYQFNLATLPPRQQSLAVAVLPTSSTDRVVFSAPGVGSLATVSAGTGAVTELGGPGVAGGHGQPGGSTAPAGAGSKVPSGAASGAAPPSFPLPSSASTTPPAATSPVVAAPSSGTPAAAPVAIPVASMSSENAKTRVVVVVLVAAVAGAIAWAGAGNAAVRAAARGLATPGPGGQRQGSG